MPLYIGLPQAILLLIYAAVLTIIATRHGQYRHWETYSLPMSILTSLVLIALLYWGGFFDPPVELFRSAVLPSSTR